MWAMDFTDLRYLLVAIEAGNLLRAGEVLGIKPSTISRRLTRMEDEIGVTIVERGAFGIRPTVAGREIVIQARRALDSFDNVLRAGKSSGAGKNGRIRLGVRMPPVGRPLQSLLGCWTEQNPAVMLTLHELNDDELYEGLAGRTLDAALVTAHTLRSGANAVPIYREPVMAALALGHPLARHDLLTWQMLREQTVLTQDWDYSHAARMFYESFLGAGTRFSSHPASKQSIMALVGAGLGITLAVKSQSEVAFPGVVYRPIGEDNAWVQVELAWLPTSQEVAVGRFVAFLRDEARSRGLF
jgi:DNA-binding transcriptional LysR family regulator